MLCKSNKFTTAYTSFLSLLMSYWLSDIDVEVKDIEKFLKTVAIIIENDYHYR